MSNQEIEWKLIKTNKELENPQNLIVHSGTFVQNTNVAESLYGLHMEKKSIGDLSVMVQSYVVKKCLHQNEKKLFFG